MNDDKAHGAIALNVTPSTKKVAKEVACSTGGQLNEVAAVGAIDHKAGTAGLGKARWPAPFQHHRQRLEPRGHEAQRISKLAIG